MQLAANWTIVQAVHTLGTICKLLRQGSLDGSRGEGKPVQLQLWWDVSSQAQRMAVHCQGS